MTLLMLILVPVVAGVLCLGCVRGMMAKLGGPLMVLATLVNLVLAVVQFRPQQAVMLEVPFGGFGLTLAFRLDAFAGFIVLCAAALGFLISLYAAQFMNGKRVAGPFFGFFLFTIGLLQGAVLADHLVTLLFFWEGMLLSLFVMISVGHVGAYRTAVKAFFINGVTDLCLMAGIGVLYLTQQPLTISALALQPLHLVGYWNLAFVLLFIGAISKAGAMPFHSWIPDAAVDAPLPFMALMPGAMEKLIGIYFVARISLDMFQIGEGWASSLMMIVGAATVILAVLMALVQKDFKRLLSFHAISQVGYMILGIGTGTTVGIVGGLFHMLNNALYKSTLFLTGGAVERQAGSTDLKQVSGLGRLMPVTFGCFLVAAFSISGFPLTNGFYSKEFVYHGAWERGWYFYAIAALGSFFTAASFLKLGHAAFLGPHQAPKPKTEIKDPPLAMLVPMVVIAAACVLFGTGNGLVIDGLIIPGLPARYLEEASKLSGVIPHEWWLVGMTILVLALAFANHWYGFKTRGSGLKAVDHIHYAPVAHQLYDAAEKRWFDPYVLAIRLIDLVAYLGWLVDRVIDFVYNKLVTGLAEAASRGLRKAHDGSHATYLIWSVMGAALVLFYFVGGF